MEQQRDRATVKDLMAEVEARRAAKVFTLPAVHKVGFSGGVYFAEALGGDAVKIGFTTANPVRRVRDLQTGNHLYLKLLGVIPGPQTLEKEIHDRANFPDRLRGEWFRKEWAVSIIQEYGDAFIHRRYLKPCPSSCPIHRTGRPPSLTR